MNRAGNSECQRRNADAQLPAPSAERPLRELAIIWDTHVDERLAFFVGQADATTSDGACVTDCRDSFTSEHLIILSRAFGVAAEM